MSGNAAEKRRPGGCPESAIKPPFVRAPLEARGEQGKPRSKTGLKTRHDAFSPAAERLPMGQW